MKVSSIIKWIITAISFIAGAYGVWTTLGRTVIKTSTGWFWIAVITVFSVLLTYLSNRKKQDTEETGDEMCGDFAVYAIILSGLLFSINYYIPISIQKRKAVIINIYKESGRRKSHVTHYILKFDDNGQEEDIYGGLSRYQYQKGDTIITTYQHGCLGLDVVTDIQH